MERHWRITLLFLGCLSYMFLGSLIFSVIEGKHEDETRTTLNNSIMLFLNKHPSVPFEDVVELLDCVKHAANQGVSPDVILSVNNASTEWQRIEKPGRKNWDMANAFFFSATVVTTIGYGHLSPSTNLGRNFCVLYAISGIPFFGWLLAEVAILCRKKGRSLGEMIHNTALRKIKWVKLKRVLTAIVMFGSVYSIIILLPALSYSHIEGWDFATSHYYCFITLSTIGFGDFVDSYTDQNSWRWLYKLATVLYFVFGLALLAVVLNSIQARQQRNLKKIKSAVARRKRSGVYHVNGKGDVVDGTDGDDGYEEVEQENEEVQEERKDKSCDKTKDKHNGDIVKESAV